MKVCNNYTFGTTKVFGMVVESQNADTGPQYTAIAKNNQGEAAAVVLGRPTGQSTVSGYKIKGAASPAVNSSYTLLGRKFFVDKVLVTKNSGDFQKLEITGKFWDGVENENCSGV
jgi:hypothetical protein